MIPLSNRRYFDKILRLNLFTIVISPESWFTFNFSVILILHMEGDLLNLLFANCQKISKMPSQISFCAPLVSAFANASRLSKLMFPVNILNVLFTNIVSSLAGPTQAISVLGLLGFWYLFVNLGEYFLVLVSAVIIHYQVL